MMTLILDEREQAMLVFALELKIKADLKGVADLIQADCCCTPEVVNKQIRHAIDAQTLRDRIRALQ